MLGKSHQQGMQVEIHDEIHSWVMGNAIIVDIIS